MGSTLSVRGDVRLGSSVSVEDKIQLGTQDTYIKYVTTPTAGIDFRVDNNRGLSITTDGGVLHGTWSSDSTVTSSDRRLKKSIKPLYHTLAESMPAAAATDAPDQQHPAPGNDRSAVVGWVLRELRPVSFKFKQGAEAKYSRYGFVAQELQQVLPSLVRGKGDRHLSVVYQDLIALLTLAAQVQEEKMSQLDKKVEQLDQLVTHIRHLDKKVEQLTALLSQATNTTVVPAPNVTI